jgi:inositol-1,4,5-trisphosphate 5-phosphatase
MFDFESTSFHDHIFEYEKTFPPRFELNYFLCEINFSYFSYPYSEEHHQARSYLRARCPAWCDRILLSHSFKKFVDTEVDFT